MRLFLLGGYGTFGQRLITLLKHDPRWHFIIAGRSAEKAKAFRNDYNGQASLSLVIVERHTITATTLRQYNTDILVDASGPFQNYALAKACIKTGIPYMDLANDLNFVKNITTLDKAAKETDTVILSGASTLPMLSYTILAAYPYKDLPPHVTIGIAPEPRPVMGQSVLASSLHQAEKPTQQYRKKDLVSVCGMTETRNLALQPEKGRRGTRCHSLISSPDHWTLPQSFPDLNTVWIGVSAGPR